MLREGNCKKKQKSARMKSAIRKNAVVRRAMSDSQEGSDLLKRVGGVEKGHFKR